MRKTITILILIFMNITPAGPDNRRLLKWGYIHHISKLGNDYISANIGKYDIISITGFRISDSMEILHDRNSLYGSILIETKKNNIILYPLISFISPGSGRRILQSEPSRKKLIRNLIKMADKNGFSGIHLDFEYLSSGDVKYLAFFLKELKETSSGLKITMAAFPQIDFPEKLAGFHDPGVISPYLDEVVLMAYDYHRPGTKAGPVTDLTWAEKNIIHLLKYYGKEQIWLGIPAYGYSWQGNSAGAVSARQADLLAKKYGFKRDISGSIRVNYSLGNKKHDLYFSDRILRDEMTILAEKHSLKGTALWRLGFEE